MGASTGYAEAREAFSAMMSDATPEEREKILADMEEERDKELDREVKRAYIKSCEKPTLDCSPTRSGGLDITDALPYLPLIGAIINN